MALLLPATAPCDVALLLPATAPLGGGANKVKEKEGRAAFLSRPREKEVWAAFARAGEGEKDEKQRCQAISSAQICAMRGYFCQAWQFAKCFCQIVGGGFLWFCQKTKFAKWFCQIVGDALTVQFPPVMTQPNSPEFPRGRRWAAGPVCVVQELIFSATRRSRGGGVKALFSSP